MIIPLKGVSKLKYIILGVIGIISLKNLGIFENHILGGWQICLDYLSEGTLYGGQPYCNQAPLIYYLGLSVRMIFGEDGMWIGFLAIKVAALVYILRMILLMSDKLECRDDFLAIALFLMIFLPISSTKPSALLSSAFLLWGLDLMMFKRKPSFAGVAFSIALMFKYTSIFPIALAVIMRANRGLKKNLEQCLDQAGQLAIPSVIFSLFFLYAHDHFIEYSILAQIIKPHTDLAGGLWIIISSGSSHAIALLACIIGFGYYFLWGGIKGWRREIIAYPLICLPIIILSLTKTYALYHTPRHYGLQLYPLLILSALMIIKKKRLVTIALVSLVLLYPGVDGQNILVTAKEKYNAGQMDALKIKVMSGLGKVPAPEKGLLFESSSQEIEEINRQGAQKYFQKYGWEVKSKDNTFITPREFKYPVPDSYWYPRLQTLVNITFKMNQSVLKGSSDVEKEMMEDIEGGRYDVIMFTAKSWREITKVTEDLSEDMQKHLCYLYIPDFTHEGWGRDFGIMMYSNLSKCIIGEKEMTKHYSQILPEICRMNPRAGEIVISVMKKHENKLGYICATGPADRVEKERIEMIDILLALFGFAFCIWHINSKP